MPLFLDFIDSLQEVHGCSYHKMGCLCMTRKFLGPDKSRWGEMAFLQLQFWVEQMVTVMVAECFAFSPSTASYISEAIAECFMNDIHAFIRQIIIPTVHILHFESGFTDSLPKG